MKLCQNFLPYTDQEVNPTLIFSDETTCLITIYHAPVYGNMSQLNILSAS